MSPHRPAPPPPFRPNSERGAPPPQRRGPLAPAARGRKPPPPRRGGFLRALMYLGLLILIVAGAAVAYLAINPPSDLIRSTIAEQVKARTGRDLVVAGAAAFSFYPGLGVKLKDVSISGPAGAPEKLVTMSELVINIKTMPLINRQVEVRRLIVRQPVFDLRIDKAGKKNWNFAELAEPRRFAMAETPSGTANDASDDNSPGDAAGGVPLPGGLAQIDHLEFDDVRIDDGTFRFTDERSGKTQEVNSLNANISLKSLQSPILADGDLNWRGEKVDFDGKLTSARAVLEERPARLVFKTSSNHQNSTFEGNVLIKDGADLEGEIMTKSDSARGLAKWLGTNLPPVSGFGPLSLAGTLKTNGNVSSLSNASFGLDGATATGIISMTTGGIRPYVQANLKISELDLNKYMTGAAGDDSKVEPAQPPPSPSVSAPVPDTPPAGAPEGGDQIEKLLKTPATKVYGFEQRAGWSSLPFNMALLGLIDTDSKLQIGRLKFNDIRVGQSSLIVALKDRVMKTSFDDVQLYDGHGKGFLNIDATGSAAHIGANFSLDGLSALPFLKDGADLDWLSGNAKLGLQLASNGVSPLQLVESLNGKADFKVANGAIVGFNVPTAIRGISQGNFSGLKKSTAEKTEFSEMSGSFNVVNGVAQNQDLQLVSPMLRVTGAGAVQLPGRTVDYTMKPKVVAGGDGPPGAQGQNGIEIPVRITGPWSKPVYEPDFKGVLSDPKTVETVKEIGKQLKGKSAGQIVNELLGKKSSDGTTSNAKDLLNKFLKPQQPQQPQ